MFCQSATLLLGHVGPAVCVCLFLRLTEHMERAIQCLFGCRRCRAELKLRHKHTEVHTCMHARNSRCTNKKTPEHNYVHMWKHNLGSWSSRRHTRSRFGSVIVTVSVSPGHGSSLPLPSCWLWGLQAAAEDSTAGRHREGGLASQHSAGLSAEWLVSCYGERVSTCWPDFTCQLFILIVQTPCHKHKLHISMNSVFFPFLPEIFFSLVLVCVFFLII